MAENAYLFSEGERRAFAKIVARAWAEEEFAARYEAEPHAVLAEHGIDYPRAAQAPALPARPAGEVNLEALEFAAGSYCFCSETVSCMWCVGGTCTAGASPGL